MKTTIELNLLCDNPGCHGGCVTSDVSATIDEALASVIAKALRSGWRVKADPLHGMLVFCDDCQRISRTKRGK